MKTVGNSSKAGAITKTGNARETHGSGKRLGSQHGLWALDNLEQLLEYDKAQRQRRATGSEKLRSSVDGRLILPGPNLAATANSNAPDHRPVGRKLGRNIFRIYWNLFYTH
ncbi:MAG: hypothetical protein OXI07_09945 [Gammaproteobacteria bacterium]|nr:hypothetical protein [Gammaproteobacteria bacterium]